MRYIPNSGRQTSETEIPKAVEFPKCESFNRKILEIPGAKFKMEIKRTSGKKGENLGIEVVLFFGNFQKSLLEVAENSCVRWTMQYQRQLQLSI